METKKRPKLSVEEIQSQTIQLVLEFPIGTEVRVENGPGMYVEGIVEGYMIYPSIKNYCVGLRVNVPADIWVLPPEQVKHRDGRVLEYLKTMLTPREFLAKIDEALETDERLKNVQ